MSGSQQQTQATQIEQQRLGYNGITLTNFTDAASSPAIASGSKVEVAGALFFFSSDEAISNWASVGDNTAAYVKLTVSGTAVTAAYTDSAPVWSDSKQGYYASAASTTRYIGGLYRASAAVYQDKWVYQNRWKLGEDVTNGELVIEHAGVIIRQGAYDSGVLQFKSTDVGHGLTSIAPTDVYGKFIKNDATGGGLRIDAVTDGVASTGVAYSTNAYLRETADTTVSSAGVGVTTINSAQHDGANAISAVADAGNLLAVQNNSQSRLLVHGNGDLWLANNLSVHGATDDDSTITFATDASLLWDESETEFYFDQSIKINGGIETDGTKVRCKRLDIGEWNMQATTSLTVAHGLSATALTNVIDVRVAIRNDLETAWYPPTYTDQVFASTATNSLSYFVQGANMSLRRNVGSIFDSTAFNATAGALANRGHIFITYYE
jgi:hypothetical protein